jgi:hypothetical protein
MKNRNATKAIRFFLFLTCLVVAGVGSVIADEPENSSTQLSLTVATTKEIQSTLTHAMDVRDNLKLKLSASISPVSVGASLGANWLPFPFLELVINSTAGSGWNIPIANGLRINQRVDPDGNELVGDAFAGLIWSIEGGGAFQFDYAALVPGDWNHILFRTYHGLEYKAFTAAEAGVSWLYQADEGENRNGWSYYGNAFIGYQMPLVLNLVGLLVEGDKYLYDSPDGEEWGDDLIRWTLGVVTNFTLTKNLGLTIISQANTVRNFTSDTRDYGFYQDRRITEDPVRLQFYRLAAILTLVL